MKIVKTKSGKEYVVGLSDANIVTVQAMHGGPVIIYDRKEFNEIFK